MPQSLEQRRAWTREWYQRNKERVGESHRRWREKHGKTANARCRRWHKLNPRRSWANRLRFEHGLSLESWDALVKSQWGRCAICNEAMKLPQVDHCHLRGVIRGLLCRPCNLAIGIFRESPHYLADYHEAKANTK